MTAVDITTVPLSRGEEVRLASLEQAVHDAINSFVAGGRALDAIRNGQLYRQTHSTFEAYVDDRFGYARAHAYRLIEAAKVAEIVSPIGDIANEAQARELVGLEPEQTREVYRQAIEAASNGKPTAAKVREARLQVVQQPAQARRKPLPDAFLSAALDLGRSVERITRLTQDDRFSKNADTIGGMYLGNVRRAIEALQRVQQALEPAGGTQTLDLANNTIQPEANNTVLAKGVVIEVGSNTATVLDGRVPRSIVRAAIVLLGIGTQPGRDNLVTFGARHADDLQAALEDRGIKVELRRVTP